MRYRLWFVVTVGVGLLVSPASAQQFVERVYQDEVGSHKYAVFVPAGYSPSTRWPAILFLHGAGERGTDGKKPTLVGLGPYAKARGSSFPFIVVFPQVEETRSRLLTAWKAGEPASDRALKILDEVTRTYAVDSKRIALVGWSMGGYGAWSLGAAHPERWSAVMPISGGGNPDEVAALKDVPVWAFHGTGDHLVPVTESQRMVEALRTAGGKVSYDEVAGGHDISDQVFGNDGVIAWLLDPRRSPPQLSPVSRPLKVEPPPFVPALEIPQAVGIRLGNDALKALSYAAPQMVPPGMLTGRIRDMYDSTVASGRSFSVTFSGISYTGQLERASIQAIAEDRVRVQLGLRNVILTIAGTYVSGARQSAQAGPMNIGIGHNRAVWLTVDVTPTVEDRRLRLRPVATYFSIPPESYYVTQPAGVSVQGFGMTQERVVSGLVSGLYGARNRIENEVRAVVPNIVRALEDQLKLTDAGPIVSGMWPLPVYEPRLQAYPERIATDPQGISIVLGLAAANPDLTAPAERAATARPAGVSFQELGGGNGLGVAVAPQVFGPLTKMLIDADLARIDVLDIPERSFARLADRAVMEQVLPDLKRFDDTLQIRSEIVLTQPLAVQRAETVASSSPSRSQEGNGSILAEANGDPTSSIPSPPLAGEGQSKTVPLEFRLPGVRVEVAVRVSGQRNWQPYAEFNLRIQERVIAQLQKPSHERRELDLNWTDAHKLEGEGTFASGVQPQDSTVNSDRLVELFRECWDKWTETGPAARAAIPDIAFATTKLRMERLASAGDVLAGEFLVPTIKLTNRSEEDFVYETKGPYSAWGGPYTLKPGTSQEYDIPYGLTYRHRGPSGTEVYTLLPGSHSEFLVPKSGGPPRLFQAKK